MGTSINFTAKHPFVFSDGSVAQSMYDFIRMLEYISDEEFAKHITPDKNDFATWIQHSLNDPLLSKMVGHVTSRKVMVELLEDYIIHSDSPLSHSEAVSQPEVKVKPINVSQPAQVTQSVGTYEKPSVSQEPDAVDMGEIEKSQSGYEPHVEKNSLVEETVEEENTENPTPQPEVKIEKTEEKKVVKPLTEEKKSQSYESSEPESLSQEKVHEYSQIFKNLRTEIAKVFIGQEEVVHMSLIALVCEAHMLLEGVPGLAKSVLVEVLSKAIGGTKYSRIQFLPDLLPSDVVGGQIYNPKTNEFKTIKGPIFANFVLADEVNRAPPKTHAALMEAMAERKINIDKEEFILDRPFLVMATQNPLENKGTYQLPEAVMDRFMFKVDLLYPKREHEMIIIERNNNTNPELRQSVGIAATKDKIMEMQQNVKKVHLSAKIKNYILDIIAATRGENKNIEGYKFVKYGAGPRASIALGIASKAQALIAGRNYVLPEDIQVVVKPILRHRVSLNFKGKAYNISSDKIVDEIMTKVRIL